MKPADRKLLVSTMQSDDLVVISSLAKWYLKFGIELTISNFIEYRGERCFKSFTDWVTESRRSKTGQLARTCKLVGNSG